MEIEEDSPKHLTLNIMHEDILLSSMKEKMEQISLSHCICRVPQQLHKANEEKYFPSLVSIGPFHHGHRTLKPMEDQKWRYLNALLSRKQDPEATLVTCIKSLRQVEHKARRFYGEPIQMGGDCLVEMLLLDACFIIELFLEYAVKNLRRRDDPCFGSNDTLTHLRCDLIMFENQLPFFILDQIFHLVPIPKLYDQLSLIDLALYFFKKLIPESPQKIREIFTPQIHHLLDLIRQHYLPTSSIEIVSLRNVSHTYNIPQASRLLSLGISVEAASLSESPTNIHFFNGKLKIPPLEINGYTEILFRNLIAMENCSPGLSKHVTSYIILLEGLIRSTRDVRVMQEREILIDGHEREIVFLLQRLHVDVNRDEFCYRDLCERVGRHEKRRRDVWCVRVREAYHRTGFGVAGFSLAVVVLVFLFTGVLFYTVYFLMHHFQ